jgi:hypothetical protein
MNEEKVLGGCLAAFLAVVTGICSLGGLLLLLEQRIFERYKDYAGPEVVYSDFGVSFQEQIDGPYKVEWSAKLTNEGSKGAENVSVAIAKFQPMDQLEADMPYSVIAQDSRTITLRIEAIPPGQCCLLRFNGVSHQRTVKPPKIIKVYSKDYSWKISSSPHYEPIEFCRFLYSLRRYHNVRVSGTETGDREITPELLEAELKSLSVPGSNAQ